MPNHVHIIVVPSDEYALRRMIADDALWRALRVAET
jgi:hypothetical protein